MGQHHRCAVLLVALPDHSGYLNLMRRLGDQRQGQSHHPIISTLGAADAEPASFQVDVLNAQIEWFADAQSTTIEHSLHQIGAELVLRPYLSETAREKTKA
jgi:hypothetical protein